MGIFTNNLNNYFSDEMLLPFGARDLFEVVLDVEKYPEFLPWCKEVQILSCINNSFIAKVTAQFKGIKPWYKCIINFIPPTQHANGFIKVTAIEGAFKSLDNLWEFMPQMSNGTLVRFSIEFEFRSKLLQTLLSLVYKKAQYKIISAFKERAYLKCKRISI